MNVKRKIPINFSARIWEIARNRYSVWTEQKHKRNESVTGFNINDCEIEYDDKGALDKLMHNEQLFLLRRKLAFIKSDYRSIVVAYYVQDGSAQILPPAIIYFAGNRYIKRFPNFWQTRNYRLLKLARRSSYAVKQKAIFHATKRLTIVYWERI